MNKIQKEIAKSQLKDEQAVINQLEQVYKEAIDSINLKIKELLSDEVTMSKIYQVDYQNTLKSQINAILDDLNLKQYKNINDYIEECYTNGFISLLYQLHDQHIPIIVPIRQEQVVQAVINDTKLSVPLYEKLGQDVDVLKKQVTSEISRGISTALTYNDIKRNINKASGIPKANAMRIARTEGHRVSQTATLNAMNEAKDNGAEIVKQWDATLDKRTRPSHQRVDGEIRELDEKFSNGLMYPGDPNGKASEVVNCRCVLLQRARWAVDDERGNTKRDGENSDIKENLLTINSRNYQDFKKKYFKEIDKHGK